MKSCGRRDENNDVCGETYTCGSCRSSSELAEQNAKTRDAQLAAEKERDAYKSGMEENGQALHDALQKLSLYESAPSEPEVEEALKCADASANWKLSNLKRCADALMPLARALRACQAKLAATTKAAEQCWQWKGDLDQECAGSTEQRMRAEKAESELAELRRKSCNWLAENCHACQELEKELAEVKSKIEKSAMSTVLSELKTVYAERDAARAKIEVMSLEKGMHPKHCCLDFHFERAGLSPKPSPGPKEAA